MSAAWVTVQLGEVLAPVVRERQVDPSQEYPLLGVRLDGQGPFHRETVLGTQTSASRLYEVKAGDFIYSRLFAWRGAFGLIEPELDGHFVSNEFPTFAPRNGRIDPKYLRYWFRLPDILRRVEADCSGSTPLTRNRYKEQYFCALEIPLPPLDEQRRIVSRIEELATKVEEARKLGAESIRASQALSASILDRLLPKSALEIPLGELVMPGTSISYGVLVPGPDTENGIPFARVQDLSIKSASPTPNKRISGNISAQYKRTILQGGEVLIGVVGSIGKIGIAPQSWAGANIARAVCRVIPRPDVDARFLAESLSDRRCQDYFREQTRTLAQPTLNVGQLENTPIKLPSLDEQRRIVAELDALQTKVDAAKTLQTKAAAELDVMLPAILDKAFKGEL